MKGYKTICLVKKKMVKKKIVCMNLLSYSYYILTYFFFLGINTHNYYGLMTFFFLK